MCASNSPATTARRRGVAPATPRASTGTPEERTALHTGLIHTHASLAELTQALAAMRATYVKVVPAWWPHGPQALAALPYRKALRSSHGDPSYANGARAYPRVGPALDELRPYLDLMPDAVVELGNEPSGHGLDPQRYADHLAETVAALRRAYPRATILPPAHSPHAADRVAWLMRLAPIARGCHALTIHGYSDAEVRGELALVRQHVSDSMRVWLTEVNYGQAMPDAARAAGLRQLLGSLPGVDVALLYHLDTHASQPLEQQGGAHYRLSLATLQALGREPAMEMDRDIRADLARYRAALGRGDWQIGARPRTTAITLHWNGPAVPEHRRRGGGAFEQLRIDLEWQTRPGWGKTVRGADGLQYHAAVDADGVVWHCRDHGAMLWHCAHAVGNAESLSLHLLAGRGQSIPDVQWSAAEALIENWRRRHAIPRGRVLGHQEWTATDCPGPDIMARLRAYRASAAPAVPPAAPSLGLRRFVVALPAESRATVRQGPARAYPVAGHLKPGAEVLVDAVLADELGETIDRQRHWAHMALVPGQQADLGFVHLSALREDQ